MDLQQRKYERDLVNQGFVASRSNNRSRSRSSSRAAGLSQTPPRMILSPRYNESLPQTPTPRKLTLQEELQIEFDFLSQFEQETEFPPLPSPVPDWPAGLSPPNMSSPVPLPSTPELGFTRVSASHTNSEFISPARLVRDSAAWKDVARPSTFAQQNTNDWSTNKFANSAAINNREETLEEIEKRLAIELDKFFAYEAWKEANDGIAKVGAVQDVVDTAEAAQKLRRKAVRSTPHVVSRSIYIPSEAEVPNMTARRASVIDQYVDLYADSITDPTSSDTDTYPRIYERGKDEVQALKALHDRVFPDSKTHVQDYNPDLEAYMYAIHGTDEEWKNYEQYSPMDMRASFLFTVANPQIEYHQNPEPSPTPIQAPKIELRRSLRNIKAKKQETPQAPQPATPTSATSTSPSVVAVDPELQKVLTEHARISQRRSCFPCYHHRRACDLPKRLEKGFHCCTNCSRKAANSDSFNTFLEEFCVVDPNASIDAGFGRYLDNHARSKGIVDGWQGQKIKQEKEDE